MQTRHLVTALLATLLWAGAVIGFGAAFDGYGHRLHPVALLGARGVPGAQAFNVLGYLLPGSAAAWLAWSWRSSPWPGQGLTARLALQCLLVAAVAFMAQGALPLDPTDLDASASRLHAAAWTAWWVASVAGLLLGTMASLAPAPAVPGEAARRPVGAAVAMASAGGAMVALVATDFAGIEAPVAQRLAQAAWFAGLLVLAARMPGRGRR